MTKEEKAKEYAEENTWYPGETSYESDINAMKESFADAYKAGWDDALQSQFRKCKDNKPIKGQEPKDGEHVILLCQVRGGNLDGYVFPKANTFKNGDWEGKMLMRYNIIAWMSIPPIDKILKYIKNK